MKITILCVGKLKEAFYREAAAEYVKRLGRYCKPEIIEVADEKTPDGAGAAAQEQIRAKEGGRILARLEKLRREGAFVCALAIDGKQMDSLEFATKLGQLENSGIHRLVFLIGGSLGMPEQVLGQADLRLSFSRMTFPHQLMRVILLEQVYRGYRIICNEPYHK